MFNFFPLLAILPAVLAVPAATTVKTTSKSSSKATSKSTSSVAPAATGWWKPTLADTFLYDGEHDVVDVPTVRTNFGITLNKSVYIVDLQAATKEQNEKYHLAGKKVACYLSAGSFEPLRPDWQKFNTDCYCGKGVGANKTGWCNKLTHKMDGWDEFWLNIGDATCRKNIEPIMLARMQEAKAKGCDAVDPDNMDAFTNDQYGITEAQQVSYLTWFADQAHSLGLGIGLKNCGELLGGWGNGTVADPTEWTDTLVNKFDFSVIEACQQWEECHTYKAMLDAKKPQLQVEYERNTTSCPTPVQGVTFYVHEHDKLDPLDVFLDCPYKG